MKTFLGVVIAACVIAVPVLVLAFAPAPDAGGKSIDFKPYNGYAESRESGLRGSDSFLALTTWAEFTHCFDPVVTPRGAPDPVARSSFDNRLFVAVIKRDNVLWDFKMEKVTANGDTLSVYYRTTPHKVVDPPRYATMKGETRKVADTMKFDPDRKYTAKQLETKKYVETPKETKKVEVTRKADTKKYETRKDETAKDEPRKYETRKYESGKYETRKEPASESGRPASSIFDSSLILSVPKDKYASVIFFENGRKVGSARIGN